MKNNYKAFYEKPISSKNGYSLRADPVNENLVFEINKPIQFNIELTKDGKPCDEREVHAFFRYNSTDLVFRKDLTLTDGKSLLEFECDRSGFGILHVLFYKDGKEVCEQLRGLAVSPEELKRSYPCPDDFDAFWENKKKELFEIPIVARYQLITKNSNPELHETTHKELLENEGCSVESYDVNVDCLNKNISGILTLPTNAKPKSLPALLFVHGAGVRPCAPGKFHRKSEKGLMIYEMNAHGIPNDKPLDWYQKLNAEGGELFKHEREGRHDRDKNYFTNMALRVKRGLDFLKSREEWDGKNLIIFGGSQGAWQSYAGAYLEPDISAIFAFIPAYSDLTGSLMGRQTNWPDWLNLDAKGRVDQDALKVLLYIDGVNFMKDYEKEFHVAFGLLDQGCKPTPNFVAINECPAKANVYLQSDSYHRLSPECDEYMWGKVFEHIKN
ncbi:MAG: hypothetical protein COA79_09185 [Planctomycetota bacterium]|nr:MAG: hypothetical protein COA79_09185 [Planctomycetota bacterium]